MEKIEENDYEEESQKDKLNHMGNDGGDEDDGEGKFAERPLRSTVLRESGAYQEGDNRYTCIEGSAFDVGVEDEAANFGGDEGKEEQATVEADILMNGNAGVGKTSIIERFIKNTFNKEGPATLGEQKLSRNMKLDAETVIKMQITDIEGNQIHGQVPKQLYRDLHAVIIVFDITERSSFDTVEQWIKVARDQAPRNAVITVVGNKGDLAGMRKVSAADGHVVAQKNNVDYFEVSAKSGNNIALLFEDLANKIVVRMKENVGEDKVERKKERKSLGLKDAQLPDDDDTGKKCC